MIRRPPRSTLFPYTTPSDLDSVPYGPAAPAACGGTASAALGLANSTSHSLAAPVEACGGAILAAHGRADPAVCSLAAPTFCVGAVSTAHGLAVLAQHSLAESAACNKGIASSTAHSHSAPADCSSTAPAAHNSLSAPSTCGLPQRCTPEALDCCAMDAAFGWMRTSSTRIANGTRWNRSQFWCGRPRQQAAPVAAWSCSCPRQ